MISSVSNLSFRGEGVNAQDLINSQGQFTTSAQPRELPPDSFEKEDSEEKHSGVKALIGTLAVALAGFAGLGYAVKKGHLEKTVVNDADKFFTKLWQKTKNVGFSVGDSAVRCWDNTLGKLFTKNSTKAS
jgi:hypothetical protein